MRFLQSLLNVYEDARLSKQNVYAVYVDYSNAFNTINQDKLLHVLHVLSFPIVAVDAVKEHASRVPRQESRPVLERLRPLQWTGESYKGNTLSPFLFNCFTEPLTRWLACGWQGLLFWLHVQG